MADPHPPEWHKARAKGIGGSDWGHLLPGISKYGCARQLWYQKSGFEPDIPPVYSGPMERGHQLEPLVLQRLRNEEGWNVRHHSRFQKTDIPEWWIGNIDSARVGLSPEPPEVVEVKTTNPFSFNNLKRTGELPLPYAFQGYHYLGLTGWNRVQFVFFEPVAWQHHILHLDRDDAILTKMREVGQVFWQRVLTGEAPEAPEDAPCSTCPFQPTCKGEVTTSVATAEEEIWDAQLEADGSELLELNAILREAENAKTAVNQRIANRLDSKYGIGPVKLISGNIKVNRYEYERSDIDSKALRQEQPDIAEKFTRKKVISVTRINKTKKE
jgi:predicted phage-related endonuclease